MKYFSSLKIRDIISLTVLIAAGFGWILIDQEFLSETYQRMLAFTVILTVLYLLQFVINKPENIWKYATTVAVLSITFVILTSIIMHILVHHDFTVKGLIIISITAAVPYCSGGIYLLTRSRK